MCLLLYFVLFTAAFGVNTNEQSCHDVGYQRVYRDPDCAGGGLGCNADNQGQLCRFCGFSPYPPCPSSGKEVPKEVISCHNIGHETVYCDPSCTSGGVGCNAGGQNPLCRFCGFSTYPACPTAVDTSGAYARQEGIEVVSPTGDRKISICSSQTSQVLRTVQPPSLRKRTTQGLLENKTPPTPIPPTQESCLPPPPGPPGPGDPSGLRLLCSLEEFNEAVMGLGFPKPSCEQYRNCILKARAIGGIKKKREFAMFLAHVIWESNGLQDKEEPICKRTKCPDLYKSPQDCDGQHYYGRGYLRLSWCGNYTAASQALLGDDRLRCNPGQVATDDSLSWSTALWFWKKNVHNIREVRKGHFGASTNAINGDLECRGEFQHVARRRFENYKHVLKALHIKKRPKEKGCYN